MQEVAEGDVLDHHVLHEEHAAPQDDAREEGGHGQGQQRQAAGAGAAAGADGKGGRGHAACSLGASAEGASNLSPGAGKVNRDLP